MKKNSVAKRGDCERAAEHYAREIHGCVITRRAIRTQFQSVDFFASDIVGKLSDGTHVYIQATAGQASAVSARRKKLEQIPWHPSDVVELVQLVSTENPANARQTLWFFKVYQYMQNATQIDEDGPSERSWSVLETAIPVDKSWFKKFKGEEK